MAVRARQQAAVADLGVRALGTLPLAGLLDAAAHVVADALGVEFVKILELAPDNATARVVAGIGWKEGTVGAATITVGRDSQAGYALLTHAPVVVDHLGTDARLEDTPLLRDHGVVSGMSVILYGPEGRSYGVLGAHTARRRRFTQDDVNFLQGVANVVSAAMHRRHVEDELRRATTEAETFAAQLQEQAAELELQSEEAQALAEELEQANEQLQQAAAATEAARDRAESLQRATAALAGVQTVADVGRVFSRELTTLVGADTAWVGVVTPDGRAVEALGWAGYSDEAAAHWRRVPLDDGISLTDAIRTGRAHWWGTADALVAAYPGRATVVRAAGQEGVAILPLLDEAGPPAGEGALEGPRAIGGIVVGFRAPQAFDAETRAHYLALAQQCAQAVARARAFEAERAARAQAEAAQRAAEAANRAKGEFLANMSHELRTPLNAIAGHVQLVELGLHGPITDAQGAALGRVQSAGRHLLGLINDVLNYAKLEAGKVAYDLQEVDLREVVAAAAPLVEPQRLAKGLGWDTSLPDAPCLVWADREKVGQVLLNLLSNAVKFTPEGGRVVVRVTPDGEPDGTPDLATIEVADTGIGIPEERLASIFDPFVQVNASRARGHEGTGLGLTISRDLARGMGGEVSVSSAVGAGSVFRLRLRRVVADDGRHTERRFRNERREGPERRGGARRRTDDGPGKRGG